MIRRKLAIQETLIHLPVKHQRRKAPTLRMISQLEQNQQQRQQQRQQGKV